MERKFVTAGALVAVVVVAAAVTGLTAAASGGSIEATPDEPGATAEHAVTVTVDGDTAGDSWNGFKIWYDQSDASNVGQNDVTTIGIDRGDNASGDTIDVDVSDDLSSVSGSSNGETLTVGLGGNYNLQQGDEVVVVYENVQNPDAGDYGVDLEVNHQSSGGQTSATLSIESDQTTTQTTTETTSTTTQTTTQSTQTTTTDDSTSDDQTSDDDTATTTTAPSTTTADTGDGDGADDGDDGTDTGGNETGTDGNETDTGDNETDTGGNETDVGPTSPTIEPSPEQPNATAAHAVTVTVGNETAGDSWNGLEVNYTGTGTDVSDVGQGDVTTIGIDRGANESGSAIDVNVSDDLSSVDASNDGETLTVGLGGNYDLQAGDEVVVVYEDVQNPETGAYLVSLDVNHQSSGGEADASFVLLSDAGDETGGTTATTQTDDGATDDTAAETTDAGDDGQPDTMDESTPGEAPGIGAIGAVVALVAGALLARR